MGWNVVLEQGLIEQLAVCNGNRGVVFGMRQKSGWRFWRDLEMCAEALQLGLRGRFAQEVLR